MKVQTIKFTAEQVEIARDAIAEWMSSNSDNRGFEEPSHGIMVSLANHLYIKFAQRAILCSDWQASFREYEARLLLHIVQEFDFFTQSEYERSMLRGIIENTHRLITG